MKPSLFLFFRNFITSARKRRLDRFINVFQYAEKNIVISAIRNDFQENLIAWPIIIRFTVISDYCPIYKI